MKTLSIILVLVTSSVYGAEKIQTQTQADYSKSVTTMVDSICKFKIAESTSMKNFAEYIHKMITIEELQEKIRALKLDNEMKEAQQFYAKRKLYKENKVFKKVTPEQLKSLADEKPEKLASFIDRKRNLPWPSIFEKDPFIQQKDKIDTLFTERSLDNSGVGSENYSQIQYNLDIMKGLLKDEVDNMKPMEYLVYKKFLDSVNYESQEVYNHLKDLVASK